VLRLPPARKRFIGFSPGSPLMTNFIGLIIGLLAAWWVPPFVQPPIAGLGRAVGIDR
jgi:hypothetical protein